MAEHHVEAPDGFAVQAVDGQPGGVADDVEARMGGVPLRGEPAAEQPVDLHSAVELLAEVLPAGVGDADAEGELEHHLGAGPVHGADGGGGVPAFAVRSQVVEESGVEQGGHFGTVPEFTGLPGVERNRCGVVGEAQPLGVGGDQLRGRHRTASVGPGGFGGQDGPVDGHPVQREGAVRLGRVEARFGVGEPLAALGGGVLRMAEQKRLLRGEEEVRFGRGVGGAAPLGDESGGAAYRVGDPGHHVDPLVAAGLTAQQSGDRDGVGGRCPFGRRLQDGRAEAVPARGRPVEDGDEQCRSAGR